MKAQFIVTIEGKWFEGARPVTRADVEMKLHEVVKERFEFLADRVTVKRYAASKSKEQAK
jgi:hypothetical protein